GLPAMRKTVSITPIFRPGALAPRRATALTAAAVPRNALRDSINDATISERFQEVAAPAGSYFFNSSRDRFPVNFVRTIREPQRAGVGPRSRQFEVLARCRRRGPVWPVEHAQRHVRHQAS